MTSSPKSKRKKKRSPKKQKRSSKKLGPYSKKFIPEPNKPKEIQNDKTFFLCVWWMQQAPHASIFDNEIAAESASNVRNGLMITFTGQILSVVDWFRRNDEGKPMPAEFRDLQGTVSPFRFGPRTRTEGEV